MSKKTALAQQLIDKLPDIGDKLLHNVAVIALQSHNLSVDQALSHFVREVRNDGGAMMLALHHADDTRVAAKAYLTGVLNRDILGNKGSKRGASGAALTGHPVPYGHDAPRFGTARPSPLPKRGKGAISAMKDRMPEVFEKFTLVEDDRAIGDLRWNEIPEYLRMNSNAVATRRREIAILKAIQNYAVPDDPNRRIHQVVSVKAFKEILARHSDTSK